jgi:O-antigen/teichoic acid export membrane protein
MSEAPGATRSTPSDTFSRLIRSGVFYALGVAAQRASTVLLLPVYTRLLTPEEVGTIWVLSAAAGIATLVLAMGLPEAVIRFGLRPEAGHSKAEAVASAFLPMMGWSALALGLVWFFRDPLSSLLLGRGDRGELVVLACTGVWFEVGSLVPLSVLRAENRAARHMAWSVARLVLSTSLTLVLLSAFRLGLTGVWIANAIVMAILFVAALPIVTPYLRARPSRALARPLVRFGTPIMVATLLSFVLDTAYVYILRPARGLEEVSQYGVLYRVAKLIHTLLSQPFSMAWLPLVLSVRARAQQEQLVARTLTYATLIVSLAAMGSTLFRQELVALLATGDYLRLLSVYPWIAFGVVFSVASQVVTTPLILANRTELITLTMGLAAATNLVLGLLWIPRFGASGAAFASFVSTALLPLLGGWLARRHGQVRYEWGRILVITTVVAGFTAIGLWAERAPRLESLVLRVGACVAAGAFFLTRVFLRPGEIAAIRRSFDHVRRFRLR